ncbi:hypothetical protein KW782_04120 [Candidatus Parcubacteria bacterium]|nr:hypothetical protein [Candidatus Parcubacteria bacterium]
MIAETHTKKVVAILGIMVVLAIAAVCGLFWMIRNNVQKTTDAENSANERTLAGEKLKELETFAQEEGSELERVTTRVIAKDGVVAFIEMIERHARDLGLAIEVQGAKERAHESMQEYQILELSMRTQGSWVANYRFLTLLENAPYKLTVQSALLNGQPALSAPTPESSQASGPVWTGIYSFNVLRYK